MSTSVSQSTTVGNFSWTWSKLKNFTTCPRRYYNYEVAKTVKEPESDALRAGNALHAHFDARISKGTPLPLGYGQYEDLCAKLAGAPGVIHTEQKLALTSEFKPTTWFGKDVWLRAIVDYAVVRPNQTATVLDFKTGRPSDDLTQLQILSATMFHHDTKLQRVKAALMFVGHGQVEQGEFTRASLPEIWSEVLPRVKQLSQARQENNYPPRQSGLCKKDCAVSSCEFHGR
jgi:hypothetical protein